MDRLQAMRTFMRVLETGSFTAAAAALGVGQPTVSKHVSRLEAQVGATLLERSTHELAPTPAGAELYRRSARLLSALDATDDAVRAADGQPQGTLRIAAPAVLWPTITTRLGGLLGGNAGLSITLFADGPADLTLRLGALPDGQRLLPGEQRVYASPRWLEAHGPVASLSTVGCIALAGVRSWRLGEADVPIQARFVAPDIASAAAAARAGVGVALLPAWAADGLDVVSEAWVASGPAVWAHHAPARFPAPALSAVIEALTQP